MSFHLNYEPSTLSMKSRLKLSCFAGAPFVFALLRACTAWFVLLLFVSLSLPAMRGVCRRCGLSARGPHCARRHLNSSACGRCCWTTCCSEYKHTNITTHIHTCVHTYMHTYIHTYILLELVPRQASQRSRGAPPPRPGVAAGCQPGRVQEQRAMSALLLLLVGSLAAVPALEVQCEYQ